MPPEPSTHDERTSPDTDPRDSPLLLERLHRALAGWNARRLRPGHPTRRWREELEEDLWMRTLEGEWIEAERSVVAPRARDVPRSPEGFVRWFEALRHEGAGQLDPLLGWIAERAALDQIRWWLRQELAGEAGLDDLLALTRLRLPGRSRMQLARFSRDETGRGPAEGVASGLLDRLDPAHGIESDGLTAVWESLALSNLLLGLAANRRYAWHAVGALGALLLTEPDRAEHLDRGLRRLGLAGQERHSLALDRQRSSTWNCEVLAPLVEEDPDRAPSLAEGALLRLRAGARCFRRYRSELGVPGSAPPAD